MGRYYNTIVGYTDWGRENYENAIFDIFVLIGKYIGYERKSYVGEAMTFSNYIKRLDVYQEAEQKSDLPIILADRGFKKVRDIMNEQEPKSKRYFKGELLYLSKKRKAFPIRLPKCSDEVLSAICDYIKQKEELLAMCQETLEHNYYSTLSSKNDHSCTQILLGFQYQCFIKGSPRARVKGLYDKIRQCCLEKKILF